MKKLILLSIAILLSACSKDSEDGSVDGLAPTASALVAPINNSECQTGTSVSATQSSVSFQWNSSANTVSYFLYIKNLTTQTELQYNPGASNSIDVTLLKGTPYSWYVVSKSAAGATATSAKWKFYNAGEGVSNYAPFPAEAVSPLVSSSVYGPVITLEWDANDLDDDITEYKVYLDTNTNPTTLKTTTNLKTLSGVAVNANTTYYWKVDTKDSAGNISHSPVFQFRVL